MPSIYNEFKEHENNSNFKIHRVMNFLSKTQFSYLLLSINFNEKNSKISS
jgi:hypothetical protein